uniref:Uncharacterized protein n=1 Tax=Arion vulgaris TaxID=1028688 RepID=A0A0B7A2N3_9EUPU
MKLILASFGLEIIVVYNFGERRIVNFLDGGGLEMEVYESLGWWGMRDGGSGK